MNVRKMRLTYLLLLSGLLAFGLVLPGSILAKDFIKLGYGISLTGKYAPGATGQIEAYDLWLKKVNEKGGIYLKQYGKKLPIKVTQYDDRSSADSAIKIYEKLITNDEVDLLLAPYSTAIHYAIAPVIERFKIPLVGATCGTYKFKKELKPKYFWLVDAPTMGDVQAVATVDLLKSLNVKTVALIVTQEQYPQEMYTYLKPTLQNQKFNIVVDKDFPFGAKDHTGLLLQVKEKNPDAFLVLCYPADAYTITTQIQEVGYNPKLFFLQVGPCTVTFEPKFGAAVNGIMGVGRWSPKAPFPGAKEFHDDYVANFKRKPDYFNSTSAYCSAQVLEQAVEKAGTLDREAIKKIIDTMTFQTIEGPVKFEGSSNVGVPSMVVQWINREVEIIWPPQFQTSKPLFPKPAWPK